MAGPLSNTNPLFRPFLNAPEPAPPGLASTIAMPSAAPALPAAIAPVVSKAPSLSDTARANYADVANKPDTISGIHNPLLRGIARAGDIAASVFAPRVAQFIPGTTLHHEYQVGIAANRAKTAEAQDQAEAQLGQTEAQTDYTRQRPAIEQSKIDQKQTANQQRVSQQAAGHGLIAKFDEDGMPSFEADPNSPITQKNQALIDYSHAQADAAAARAELDKSKNDPTSASYQLNVQKLKVAQQNAQTAIGRLGLSAQEFGFNQDKFYNPQPTATERTKGDLAQSAVERIAEMRQVVSKHPDWFGPGAGRVQNIQTAIGNQDPDIQTYMSAAQYLADHSAGVFGGRGKYITQQLHSLTDPHFNPGALNAALDEAERSATGFVKAGTVHGKGGTSGYGGGSGPVEEYERDAKGNLVKKKGAK